MSRSFLQSSSQYLKTSSVPVSGPPFTISAHFNIASGFASTQYILSMYSEAVSDNYYAMAVAGPDLYALINKGGALEYALTPFSGIDTWHHGCMVTYSTNSRAIFLNGGKNLDTGTLAPTFDTLGVGTLLPDAAAYQYHFNGMLGEVGIYDVALTDEEVYILNLGVSPLLVRPQNLVFYLPLVRDEDNDLVGGVHMTAVAAPTVAEHPRALYPSGPQNTFYSFPVISAIGEVSATILAKTPHLGFSEKYPSIGIVSKTPKIEIST